MQLHHRFQLLSLHSNVLMPQHKIQQLAKGPSDGSAQQHQHTHQRRKRRPNSNTVPAMPQQNTRHSTARHSTTQHGQLRLLQWVDICVRLLLL
jgi:hypothetical protein